MIKLLINLCPFFFLVIVLHGCYYDNAEELYPPAAGAAQCDTIKISYSGTIAPIISNNCMNLGCHTAGHPDAGLQFDTHANFILSIPGDRLMKALQYTYTGGSSTKNMPPVGKLNTCDITKIQAWINKGHPND